MINMANEKILVVDDEQDILDLVNYNLQKEGYKVTLVTSGEKAVEETRKNLYDLILLDLMLPGIDGLEVCRSLKYDQKTKDIPIIMLTAKGEESDIVIGLELGAEDYITKPFGPKVLIARIRNLLRRIHRNVAIGDTSIIKIGNLIIDPNRVRVLINDNEIDLTITEFKLLQFLAKKPGWVYTRYQIVDTLKGEDYPVTDRSVDVQIVGLRKKLGEYGHLIETVRGVGYRFKEEV
jgi:two-component system alkaline phosphatase synthesis response regulator PhoP